MSAYARLPSDFDPETALGLAANIPAIESARAMEIARGIAIAFGDSHGLARAIYDVTGSARLAQRTEIAARMEASRHG